MLLNLRKRFLFFISISIIGFLIAGFSAGIIIAKFPGSVAALRIATVCQSLFQLIIPAIVTALIVTRRPAEFLEVDRKPDFAILYVSFAILICSIPCMNFIIEANKSLSLPESLRGLEDFMKAMEQRAADTIALLQGGKTVGDLVMSVLIIGILAGFGEELFFRGTFVRLLTTGRINPHVAIWMVAVIFSAMHLQFYGFVPRTLLGAYFGYLLLWSRSLWIPVIIHASNNIIYVVFQWVYACKGCEPTEIDNLGLDGDWWMILLSFIATVALLLIIYRRSKAIR